MNPEGLKRRTLIIGEYERGLQYAEERGIHPDDVRVPRAQTVLGNHDIDIVLIGDPHMRFSDALALNDAIHSARMHGCVVEIIA
jgi:hypothetical protein